MYQYYVQVIAGNYLKNIVNPPHQMQVHKAFLHGADEDDFMKGLSELHDTVRRIYSEMTIDSIYHTLDDDTRKNAAYMHDFIVKYAKPAVRMGGTMRNDWSCVYTMLNNKKVIMTLNVVQDKLSVKLNLANINKYTDIVDRYPEDIKEAVRSGGWECGRCHESCAGGFTFSFEGKAYNKCRCGSFVFDRIDDDTKILYTELLAREINVGI